MNSSTPVYVGHITHQIIIWD